MAPEEQRRKSQQAKETPVSDTPGLSPLEKASSSLADVLAQAERAYAAHLEAQKEVMRAYKENERQLDEMLKRAEEKANFDYEMALEEARKALQAAEADCEAAYEKAKEMAKQTYDAQLREAIRMRTEAVERAKSEHGKTMEQAWLIFAKATGQRVEG